MIGKIFFISKWNPLELEVNAFFHTQTLQLHKSIHGNPYLLEILICIYKAIFFHILLQQKRG
jgi:hypothetical protein